ncbi:hypothetical protein F0919_17915 [Taibaiella lutea]|uniref:Uncharacterized protein n=1 Tax=Taibaiella lutea TaxID=2608001 RepID=A0A5M6CBT0_9BACT|nr:hypothetical protein [Taibaiella lutea]KAA5532658.1 hypothetical protein F0919_17915 [Taibaiella lutea]
MSIRSVMQAAANKIKPAIKKELKNQGHYLTGNLERSLSDNVTSGPDGTRITGTALGYARYVNDGFQAGSASWAQLPYVIKYFIKRGLSTKEAKKAAGATIMTWMKEGMPTDNSRRFSKTNNRLKFLKVVNDAINRDIDKQILAGIDAEISKTFNKTKSETI